MKRARKVCADPYCFELQPCPTHGRKPWEGSSGRRNRMRSGSKEQRLNQSVMEEHEGKCHVCDHYGSDQVDHVVPVTRAARLPEHRDLADVWINSRENRRPIHSEPCHRIKSAEEAARARRPSA